VVGVGLNVQPLPGAAVQALGRRIACVQEIDPLAEAPTVLHRVGLPLVRALRAFEQQGFAPLVQAYARRDVLRGREVTATGAGTLDGVVEGVDAEGALVLRAGSRRERIVSGEVSVRVA
jgi:BirA family biotin operon repressor/biotin-[acetyl-CoA-carboxylase] ligase